MVRDIVLTHVDCPPGQVFRLQAKYAKDYFPEFKNQITDDVDSVFVHHPNVDLSQWPWLDDGRVRDDSKE